MDTKKGIWEEMRRIRICLTGVAVGALLVVAMPATGASAKKLLVMSEGETAVPVGSSVKLAILLGKCTIWSDGTVTENSASKVKAAGVSAFNECRDENESASEALTEIQLGVTGKYSMKGKISLSLPGPCVYTFSKWKGEYELPGISLIESKQVEGKLNKKLSSKTAGCAPTETREYNAGITSSEFEFYELAVHL